MSVVAALTAAQGLFFTPTASAGASFAISRLSGANRFATAAAVATATFPSGAGTVLLATGTSFPDALAGNFLAGSLVAPILLTDPTGSTPSPTLSALSALHPKQIIVLGGTSAVSAAQFGALGNAGYHMVRLAGANRYETMAMVATYAGTKPGVDGNGLATAILASGTNFPDALAAGPLSYAAQLPVVLTDGTATTLTPVAAQTLTSLHIGHVLSLGGTAAVNQAVDTQLVHMGIEVTHLAGANRSATSLAIAQQEVTNWGFSTTAFTLARGDDFADALAAGPAAGRQSEPLLITPSPNDPGSIDTYATDHASTLTSGDAFGGTGALTNGLLGGIIQVVNSVVASLTTTTTTPACTPTTTAPVPTTTTSTTVTNTSTSASGSTTTTVPATTTTTMPVAITPCLNYTPPTHPPGSPYPNGGLGFDISWPQCPNMELPTGTNQFDVIGVNDGHSYSINPCLQAQAQWAGPGLSLVMNLNIPVPGFDNNETNHLMQGPDAGCAALKQLSCEYYDYGYNATISSMADAALYGISSHYWWLDIEDPGSQLWSTNTADNTQLITGALDALHAAGVTAGVYSTSYQWGLITGGYAPGVPTWVATGSDPTYLAPWCGPAHAFGGGPTWLVQFGRGSFDGDFSC